jgi:hypothetical protein
MAKARRVVSDQNSEELDQLRRTVHTLMIMLENLGTSLGAAADFTDVNNIGDGLNAAFVTGVDSAATDYTGSELPIEGVIPTPKHPRRPNVGKVEDLDPKDL